MIKRILGGVAILAVLALVVIASLHYNRYQSMLPAPAVKSDTTVLRQPLPAPAIQSADSVATKADTLAR